MSEAATIDISYLLNDHGRVVRDIWLTEAAFTLSEESTPDGCFVYTTATGNITALNNYCGEILLRGKISAVLLRKN